MRRARRARCGICRRSERRRALRRRVRRRGVRVTGPAAQAEHAARASADARSSIDIAVPRDRRRRADRRGAPRSASPTTRKPTNSPDRTRPCADPSLPRWRRYAAWCSPPVKACPSSHLRRLRPRPHRRRCRLRRRPRGFAASARRRAWPDGATGASVTARRTAPSRSATDAIPAASRPCRPGLARRYSASTRTFLRHFPPTNASSVISIFPSILAASICRSTSTSRSSSTR